MCGETEAQTTAQSPLSRPLGELQGARLATKCHLHEGDRYPGRDWEREWGMRTQTFSRREGEGEG